MLHLLRRFIERCSEDRRKLRIEARFVGKSVVVDPYPLRVHDRDVVVLGIPAAAAEHAAMRARIGRRIEFAWHPFMFVIVMLNESFGSQLGNMSNESANVTFRMTMFSASYPAGSVGSF